MRNDTGPQSDGLANRRKRADVNKRILAKKLNPEELTLINQAFLYMYIRKIKMVRWNNHIIYCSERSFDILDWAYPVMAAICC